MTLAKFFDDVATGIGLGPPVDRAAIAELRADLDARLTEIAAALPHGAASIVLTKARIRAVLACETGALATEATDQEMTAPLMLGHLLDRVVAAYVVTGSVPPDPFGSAVESLRAERDERALAWLESTAPDALDELRSELVERAARVRDSWPAVESTWWPRPEDRVSIPLAGGRVRLVGRFDLLLGGAPTPVERVIVELKAGTATAVHQPDLYWYGLLSALARRRRSPGGCGVVSRRWHDHRGPLGRRRAGVRRSARRGGSSSLGRTAPRSGAHGHRVPGLSLVSGIGRM